MIMYILKRYNFARRLPVLYFLEGNIEKRNLFGLVGDFNLICLVDFI